MPVITKTLPKYLLSIQKHLKKRIVFGRTHEVNSVYSLEGFEVHKCIFVHIPKTAGVSINTSLFGNLGGGHFTIQQYKRLLGDDNFNRYFKFAFVRNPLSRLLSAYCFLQKGGFNKNNRIWAEKNISQYSSFEEFVLNWINEENIHSYAHFKPQYRYVCNNEMELEVDFIGRFENIQEDFQKICDRLSINRTLEKLNSSDHAENWESFYSTETIKIVESVYRQDFEIFNYPGSFR